MNEVTLSLPLRLGYREFQAVRNDPLCTCEDKDEMNVRIGWLICAYEAIVNSKLTQELKP